MNWAEVNIKAFRRSMRLAFDNQDSTAEAGLAGQKRVEEMFSLKSVGAKMKERLDKIQTTILQ